MKLEKGKQINFDTNMVIEGYDAKISEEDMDKLWDILQDPYKNSIGAVVREYVSNSFDSHAEADFIKNNSLTDIRTEYPIYLETSDDELQKLKDQVQKFDDDAVVVSIAKDQTGWYWATEDFGVGLSPDRVKDVFCSYLKSTKNSTNNVIGAFGIGSKSGLSYTDIIYIRTRYNGMEYQWILRKGEKSPRLDKLNEEATTEKNGTQIKIYIKEVKQYSYSTPAPELHRFRDECVSQLAYFDNVYFSDEVRIKNNYTVFKGQHWLWSTNGQPYGTLHLCLGKVAYPIDWDSLGIKAINSELALRFDIGELDIIQTREDVKYTPRTKKAILDKVEEVKKELKEKWEEQNNPETDDLLEFLDNRKMVPTIKLKHDNETHFISIQTLFKDDEIPSYKFMPFENIGYKFKGATWRLFWDYTIPSYVNQSGLKHRNEDIYDIIREKPLYRIKGSHDSKKSKYIFQEIEGRIYYLLRERIPAAVNLKQYKSNLHLDDYHKSQWRTIISTVQNEVRKCLVANSKSYAKVDIDKEWLKAQRNNSTRVFDNTLVTTYQYSTRDSYSGAWKSEKIKKGNLDKMNRTLFIVGFKEDKKDLLKIGKVYEEVHPKLYVSSHKCKYMKVMYVAQSNAKYFKDVKNLITLDNYMEQKIFALVCTAKYIKEKASFQTLDNMLNDAGYVESILSSINSNLAEDFGILKDFLEKYNIPSWGRYDSTDFYDSVYKHVEENDLFDKSLIAKAELLENYFSKIPLINCTRWHNIKIADLAKAIYRFNKSVPLGQHRKMNPNYYVNLNEEEMSWLSEDEKLNYLNCKI